MRLSGLLRPFIESEEFIKIKGSVSKDKYPISLFGLSESSKSFVISSIFNQFDKNILVVTHNEIEARKIYEDISFFYPNTYLFPSKEIVFYNIDAISGDLRWERLKVIREIVRQSKKIIVTAVDNLTSSYIPLGLYSEYTFKISLGQTIDLDDISAKFIESGYERISTVVLKGQFSIRGGILDIFPPASSSPYRIELFGDEVDSIRTFNIETQKSIDKVQSVEVFPAKELILKKENIENGIERIVKDYKHQEAMFSSKKDKEKAESLNLNVEKLLEELKEKGSFESIDSFIDYFYEKTFSFLDYFKDCFIVLDDTDRSFGKMDSIYFEFQDTFKAFFEKGDIIKGQGNALIPKEQVIESLLSENLITMDTFPKANKFFKPKGVVTMSEITLHNFSGKMDFLMEDIVSRKNSYYKTLILAGTRSRGERLVKNFQDRGIEAVYKDDINEISNREVIVTFGILNKGFEFPDLKLSVISDTEIFGNIKKKKPPKTIKGGKKIDSFLDLKVSDYVVHVNHGIGIYKGIKQLEVQGIKKDYLHIKYQGADSLYVPVEQLDMIQKYIGNEGNAPKINKLGGNEWAKAKEKAKKSINEIAESLVKLYAIRSTVKGYSYSMDLEWQKQFEEEFPYEETPDQLTAAEEIKRDMESEKPMDRLLCGDVGYGKTEVAQRAAFKAVMDGKQVAVLVPTTILADQHYNNFVQRYSDFPVKIDLLCRFRTSLEQKKTLQALKEGNVDIIIGTHRLLQKDVIFKDLGLLIVDEEQRFGVTHKEKIKEIKKNIDVLTLSATPIPRTLNMSLTGVRDISIIETAPMNRYPIQTYVIEYNDQLIRDAVLREINRGGQVYFVFNRVNKIKEMTDHLQNMIPEARFGYAHGQMSEKELEKVIIDFINNEFDVLVTTTIIETGMDIHNVNTMIIYDADKMGLSQLYQLRGRVGRTNKIAYAYFTYKKDKVLTEIAEKRLKAIKEFTELGSGFKIAMRDLEIRGAGNMMGSAQHGHMAAIGYDLYVKLLEEAVKKLKGEIKEEPVETTLDLKVDAYIPADYIEDETLKIEIYKKIAAIGSNQDKMDIIDELIDRFSDMPPAVENLIQIAYLKSTANSLGIEEVKQRDGEIGLFFPNGYNVNQNLILSIINNKAGRISIKNKPKPYISINIEGVDREKILNVLLEVLNCMKTVVES
ncbi:MAG: transcription-repair coupling factor [Bacillota bacterium]|nr:transcription-repair coupling factor [Bacillota bacterium]